MRVLLCVAPICALLLLADTRYAGAQTVSQRGFVEGTGFAFPETTPTDATHIVGDLLAREEVSVKPARWLRFGGSIDLRANSHSQVEDAWRIDFSDRTDRRPRISLRSISSTLSRGRFTLEVGKQFIRWGKADIVVPTDRFAPRDYLTVIDAPFLAVTGTRGTVQLRNYTLEAVWVPRLTPIRIPLLGQRWVVVPPTLLELGTIVQTPASFPSGVQSGVRLGHTSRAVEYSVSFYNGFNHAPDIHTNIADVGSGRIEVTRVYPPIRTYGFDAAVPGRWFTVKGEVCAFTSSSQATDEYVLYVIQLERQTGEWVFVGGYVGEVVTERRSLLKFDPDRGLSRAIVLRASYTIDANRSFVIEGAVRQNGEGLYAKGEYSQARGQHWRTTVTGIVLAGDLQDFLGQYRDNSHLKLTVRYSF